MTGSPGAATDAATEFPIAPSVTFADAGRPGPVTHVALPDFDGPLGLLLALIEARQLDVLTVPLGALAGAYLEALATLESDRLGNISGFVAVASQLILIKSRALLPRRQELPPGALLDEGPDPEAELRARLLEYRAYRDAGESMATHAQALVGLFRREPSVAAAAGFAGARRAELPPLDPMILVGALDELLAVAPEPPPPAGVMVRAITIRERAEIIRAALREAPSVVLQELLSGVRDRVVVAITFLAMLELMKRREIVVEQKVPWGLIVARGTTAEERRGAPAPTEPIDESLESFA